MLVFAEEGKLEDPQRNPRSRVEDQHKLNPLMTSGPGIEPGPNWEASALTTAPSLLPFVLSQDDQCKAHRPKLTIESARVVHRCEGKESAARYHKSYRIRKNDEEDITDLFRPLPDTMECDFSQWMDVLEPLEPLSVTKDSRKTSSEKVAVQVCKSPYLLYIFILCLPIGIL